VSKVRSTLRQFVRDWAKEGQEERDLSYGKIIKEFMTYFPEFINPETGKKVSVLHPGAGLGRLVYELAKLGYKSQGNEFSFFMLLTSNFILNEVSKIEEFELQPYIHTFSNIQEENQPFAKILIPDECPCDSLPADCDFSMVAGEFVEVYSSQNDDWDSVITCFFIDTANNIIQYIETIAKIIKPGGVWINFGPLLYHYSDMENECSIELSWEELKHVITRFGFEIKRESFERSKYTPDRKSMMEVNYNCIFFTAVKKKV